MKKILLVALLFSSYFSEAQIDPTFYGKPADFSEFASRTLIVEVLVESPKIIEKYSKKDKWADDLERYKSFISSYNSMMKEAVKNYWKYNSKIEYKTSPEVKELNQQKNSAYIVLRYFELGDIEWDVMERSPLKVPALMLTRVEQDFGKPDYKIYFPSSYSRDNKKYMQCDYKFVLTAMQSHIQWIINNKLKYFNSYSEIAAEPNCQKLKNLTLLVESDYLYKSLSPDEVKAVYESKIEFVAAEEINKSFVSAEKGKAVLFMIPYGIARTNNIVTSGSMLTYFKIIVDCETGEILWIHNPGSLPIGENIKCDMIRDEFKRINKCKI
ncbi:MAG: hypothetical protein ABI921_01620 [Panacibacter sp.]